MKFFEFTKTDYDYIVKECMLNEEYQRLLEYKIKGYSRICFDNMTIGEFSKIAPKGHFVATMNGHITAIIDNVIVDTFDCSNRMIKCCWQIM